MRQTLLIIAAALLGLALWTDRSTTGQTQPIAHPVEPAAAREMHTASALSSQQRPTVANGLIPTATDGARPTHRNRASFAEIANRPLFSPTRRRPPPVATTPPRPAIVERTPPPREPSLSISLLGVVIGAQGQPVALVREDKREGVRKVTVGDRLQRWQVKKIDSMSIEFGHKTWTRRIALFPSRDRS